MATLLSECYCTNCACPEAVRPADEIAISGCLVINETLCYLRLRAVNSRFVDKTDSFMGHMLSFIVFVFEREVNYEQKSV